MKYRLGLNKNRLLVSNFVPKHLGKEKLYPSGNKTRKFNTTNGKAYNFESLIFTLQYHILFSYEET